MIKPDERDSPRGPGESAAWYQFLTPLSARVAEPGDRAVAVVADRTWYCEARTQASTWELVRVTRLDEQAGSVGSL
ncbi:hypothetical protein [Streptomyces sp. NPDC093109]|uniref:hypothetical protein n=1 Tax=Streptomyces sp. NPDC093109 TaxID=3154977 RepID=UPI0034507787